MIGTGLLAPIAQGSDFPVYWIGSQTEGFIAAAGDVNGDGMADLVMVSKAQPTAASPQQAFVRSGLNGSLLFSWTPSLPNVFAFQASEIKPAGDLNLDGFGDIALSILNLNALPSASAIELRSGADGAVMAILTAPAVSNASLIGVAIAGAGDLDGDGWPELLVSGNFFTGCLSAGQAVYNFEAPGFGLQYYQTSWQCAQGFGQQVGRVDDVDGDGFADFYVGAWRTDVGANLQAGWIGLYSGSTGSPINSLGGSWTSEFLGGSLAGLGDVTGDGAPELAALQWTGVNGPNQVTLFSLPTFTPVYTATATSLGVSFISEVDTLGDGDGDGLDDFLLLCTTPQGYQRIVAVSGPTGSSFGGASQFVPYSLGGLLYPWGGLGDVNGDGLGDFAATPYPFYIPPYAAQGIWSPWASPLPSDTTVVFVAPNFGVVGTPTVGGTAQFQVTAPRHAGSPFQVVLAQDYAFPALPLGPFLFPLVPDALFWASLAAGIGGTINPNGQGAVVIPIPNIPSLQGAWFSASGVVYDPASPLGIGFVLTQAGFQIP